MGVIINAPDPFGDYEETVLDNFIDENVQNSATNRKPRKVKARSPAKPTDSMMHSFRGRDEAGGKRGSRRNRRYENATFLTSLADIQDFGEVAIHDFVPETISAFAQVLMEEDNFKVWNKFINSSDEEQQNFLNSLRNDCRNDRSSATNLNEETSKDKRTIHPAAYSAELCFQRIESKFKALLKKRHFPIGTLAFLEDQITSFFVEWPRSVFTSHLPNSFDRLLLHALCQYLDLRSESCNREGFRKTLVTNPKNEFCLPTATLTSYLESRLSLH